MTTRYTVPGNIMILPLLLPTSSTIVFSSSLSSEHSCFYVATKLEQIPTNLNRIIWLPSSLGPPALPTSNGPSRWCTSDTASAIHQQFLVWGAVNAALVPCVDIWGCAAKMEKFPLPLKIQSGKNGEESSLHRHHRHHHRLNYGSMERPAGATERVSGSFPKTRTFAF